MKAFTAVVAVALCCVAVASAAGDSAVAYNSGLVNRRVVRSINLQTHVEENVIQFDVANSGSSDAEYYLLPIAAEKVEHLSYVSARLVSDKSSGDDDDTDADDLKDRATKGGAALKTTRVTVTGADAAPAGTVFYRIQFKKPLAAKATATIAVNLIFTRTLKPYPAEISQSESQLVLFTDSVWPFSAYKSDSSKTLIKLASKEIISKKGKSLEEKPSGDELEAGVFSDTPAFASSPLVIHFQNEYPFVTMSSARRSIEVSHFGNINVEEHYVLTHTGAKLRGVFSRYDYQRQQKAGASFRSITATLPASATNIYYRDQIGNISTSAVQSHYTHTQMEVQPRFPMFGGWQTDFYIGYDVPASEFLSTDAADSGRYILNVTFAGAFPQAAIDELEVQVILPEFSSDIRWVTPFEVDSEARSSHVTYLDTVGRPVLILKKSNVVRAHDQNFQVVYNFGSVNLLQEPLLLVTSFFAFFGLAMLYFRIELSLSDPKLERRAANAARSLRVGAIGDTLNSVASSLPGVLSGLSRLSRGDAKATGDGLVRVRNSLAELRADPLLNNAVERLENQLKNALSAYKRAVEAGATTAHLTSSNSADKAEANRENLAKKVKERVEEAEKTLEELIDL